MPVLAAEDTGNTGTLKDTDGDGYYEIDTAEVLCDFAEAVNNGDSNINGKLMNDIDISTVSWTRLGTYNGVFDGQGHTISGLGKNGSQGFIGTLNGTVKNVTFSGAKVFFNVSGGAGVIAAKNGADGTIEKCMVTDSGIEYGAYDSLGGLAGINYGTIENSAVIQSSITRRYGGAGTKSMGGITEVNRGTIRNCYTYQCSFYNGSSRSALVSDNGDAVLENCYYATDFEVSEGNGIRKTVNQFVSGEVTYLLNGVLFDGTVIWFQNLGEDSSPKLVGKTVYSVGNPCSKKEYSNEESTEQVIHDGFDSNGFCTCGKSYESALLNEDGFYEIYNAGQLYWFARKANSGENNINGELMNDITINKNVLNEKGYLNGNGRKYRSWTPIGVYVNNVYIIYKGTFEGNGHTIRGIYISDTFMYIGLFGYITDATIRNLHLEDSYISGYMHVGGIAGWLGVRAEASDCSTSAYIRGVQNVGGIFGYGDGKALRCYSDSRVEKRESGAGVGGIGGLSNATVQDCIFSGRVSGDTRIGGIAGDTNAGSIQNCYSIGSVSGFSWVGEILGKNNGNNLANNYYLSDGQNTLGGCDGKDIEGKAEAKTAVEFQSGEVAAKLGHSFGQNIDNGKENEKFPKLGGAVVYQYYTSCADEAIPIYTNTEQTDQQKPSHNYINGICTSTKGETHYQSAVCNAVGIYEIGNLGQLIWFANQVNGGNVNLNGKLIRDIDMDNLPWTPIGNSENPYTGTFDGQNYKINNFYLSATASGKYGLFGVISQAEIKNFSIYGETVAHYEKQEEFTYGVIGYMMESVVNNIHSFVNLRITDGLYKDKVAGIVGAVGGGIIEKCSFSGTLDYGTSDIDCGGGIAGYCDYKKVITIQNCGFYGTICSQSDTADQVGGIVGYYNGQSLTIQNCLVVGKLDLVRTDYVGAIGGRIRNMGADNLSKISENYYFSSLPAFSNDKSLGDDLTDYQGYGEKQAKSVTEQQLKSGEVCYWLNGDQSTIVWYQTIKEQRYPGYEGQQVIFRNQEHCNADYISVVISWTSMSFEYVNAAWHSDTHTYDEGEWITAEGGGVIQVENKGNVEIFASFSYVKTVSEVTGNFSENRLKLGEDEKGSTTFSPANKPSSYLEDATMGTVVVSVEESYLDLEFNSATWAEQIANYMKEGQTKLRIRMPSRKFWQDDADALLEGLRLAGCTECDLTILGAISLDEKAFYKCDVLTGISMPSVETVGKYAFYNCTNIRTVDIPSAVEFGDCAFENCGQLVRVNATRLKEIGDRAFENCASLRSIELPNTISIGIYAFKGCSALEEVYVPKLKETSQWAFENCISLTEISMPKMDSLGEGAFKGCTSLKTVEMSGQVEVSTKVMVCVDCNAFSGCSSLTEVKINHYLLDAEGSFDGADTKNITLTLSMKLPSGVSESQYISFCKIKFGEKGTFMGYTFKEVKRVD